MALTRSPLICQSTQRLSFVRHVTFCRAPSVEMKKPSDPPLKEELCLQPCDHSTICALPHGLGLPPHFMASDPLTEIKLPECRPPSWDFLKVLMTLFV